MQTIPVDVARLGRVTVIVPPEQKTNPETGEVRRNREGKAVWTVGVAVRQQGRRASVIDVSLAAEPVDVDEGGAVTLVDLEAYAWTMGDRSGISFRAAAVVPAPPARPSRSDAAPAVVARPKAGESR